MIERERIDQNIAYRNPLLKYLLLDSRVPVNILSYNQNSTLECPVGNILLTSGKHQPQHSLHKAAERNTCEYFNIMETEKKSYGQSKLIGDCPVLQPLLK